MTNVSNPLISFHVFTTVNGSHEKGRILTIRAKGRAFAYGKAARKLEAGEEIAMVIPYGVNAMRRYI